jgi:hypothetical protein
MPDGYDEMEELIQNEPPVIPAPGAEHSARNAPCLGVVERNSRSAVCLKSKLPASLAFQTVIADAYSKLAKSRAKS